MYFYPKLTVDIHVCLNSFVCLILFLSETTCFWLGGENWWLKLKWLFKLLADIIVRKIPLWAWKFHSTWNSQSPPCVVFVCYLSICSFRLVVLLLNRLFKSNWSCWRHPRAAFLSIIHQQCPHRWAIFSVSKLQPNTTSLCSICFQKSQLLPCVQYVFVKSFLRPVSSECTANAAHANKIRSAFPTVPAHQRVSAQGPNVCALKIVV